MDMETLIKLGIIPECFTLPMNISERVGGTKEPTVRSVKEADQVPEKIVDIKERVGSWRTLTEEKFEKDHEFEVYAHLKKKLIKMYQDVFKEDLEPSNRLDVPPVRIPLNPNHDSIPSYNPTPRYLEKAASK